ncbi:putative nucleoredoxin 1 isoform X2 [Silene latifolia]|uniref:putative nucleoredoxin 1 isoform X2 n=1 Tax=Silene latifolia TaxID=37657 RepID=UPI003D76C640
MNHITTSIFSSSSGSPLLLLGNRHSPLRQSASPPPAAGRRYFLVEVSLPTISAVLLTEQKLLKNQDYRTFETADMDTYNNDGSNALDLDTRMLISETSSIQRGSIFNVRSFLANHMRTCHGLIRNSSNKEVIDLVEFDDIFEVKVVMICCFSLFGRSTTDLAIAQAVSCVSSELHFFGGFELVMVVHVCSEEYDNESVVAFNDFMSVFPSFSLAVPYSECDAICESLGFSSGSEPTCLMVNRNQRVEWHKPLNCFLEYGADAYPFTPERFAVITKCEESYDSWKKRASLQYFLCSNVLAYPRPSNFIRKNPGGGPSKTTIRNLDFRETCVGLYLCYTGNLIPTLDELHKRCCDSGMVFDIILVYLPFKDIGDPQLFQDRINHILEERKISWWVLPFVYWVSRRLWRLCHRNTDDRLIIINTKPRFVELHGDAVIRHFGIGGYPFSRELMLERELERLRAVTLESLLVHKSRDYVTGIDSGYQKEVPVASLLGKDVILYLGYEGHHYDKFYDQLFTYYHQNKAHELDFEVVFVGLNMKSFSDFESLHPIPWLVCPFDPEHSDLVTEKIFGEGSLCSTLVAFGKDGGICSVRAQQLLYSSSLKFPFTDNLRNEMIVELFGAHGLPECCL